MTHFYLKKGPMKKRPYHLIAEDGAVSLCGRVRRGGEGVTSMACGPGPMNDGLVCERCRQVAAVEAVKRVAESSPFVAAEA